jgi:polyisoprenyl-teichoic acid--peptidoglycan teichoic acid transferase
VLLRSALASLLIVALTAGATATAGLLKLDDILPPTLRGDVIPELRTTPPKPGKPQTVLLLGSDRRWTDGLDDRPRSDTMMLVRVDPSKDATTVLSIPRDLRAAIPGHGMRKINDAYALGGPKLTLRAITGLTGLKVHHVVNVNFRGFREAINLFGCFYADVDRRYFHSNRGVPIGRRYDAIDLRPGYQRLCGIDALDYVRYRHEDSDIVRAARQQDFLRAAKDQVSTSRLIDDLERLGQIAGRAMQSDANLRSKAGFVRFAKLALQAADRPVRQVRFPATFVRGDATQGDFIEAAPAAVAAAVDRFLHGGGRAAARRPAPRRRPRARAARRPVTPASAGLVEARAQGERLVREAGRRARSLGFPLRFPSHLSPRARYDGRLVTYGLRDRAGTLHRAYRFVVAENRADGQFSGVQGTTWRNPPLLAHPTGVRRVGGRRLELFRAGRRLRFVAWRTDRAAYWIANTLTLELDNDEMLALAASLTTAK